jgi:hypothetical protein
MIAFIQIPQLMIQSFQWNTALEIDSNNAQAQNQVMMMLQQASGTSQHRLTVP